MDQQQHRVTNDDFEDYTRYRVQLKKGMLSRLNYIANTCINRAEDLAARAGENLSSEQFIIDYYDLAFRSFLTILNAIEGRE